MKPSFGGLERLGRSSLAGPGIFIPTLLWSVLLQLNDVAGVPIRSIPLRILLVVVVHIVVFNIVFVARKYLLPVNRGGLQWVKAAVLILLAGLLRGYFIAVFGHAIGLFATEDVLFRMLLSMQNTSLMFALCAYVSVAAKDWAERRGSLEIQNQRLQELLDKSLNQINEAHDRVIATVTGQLYRFVHDLEKVKPEDLVESLRAGVANIVRPLSREVLQETAGQKPIDVPTPRLSISQVVKNIQSPKDFDALLIPVMMIYVSLPYSLRIAGFESALVASVVIVLIGSSYLWLWQRLEGYLKLSRPMNIWLSLLARVLSFALLLNWLIIFAVPRHVLPAQRLIFYLVIFSTLAQVAYALAKSAELRIQEIEQELRAVQARLEWENSRVSEIKRQQARALSIAIHGPVQTAVGAAIIRLELALKKGPISSELVEEVTELIWQSLESLGENTQSANLSEVFEELTETWRDVCEISVYDPEELVRKISTDAVVTQLIVETVPELIFNAIKHGGATRASVELFEPDADSVTIEVRNNGAPFEDSGTRGLGLRYLADAALSVMNLHESGENITLVVLPFENTEISLPPPPEGRPSRGNPYLDALSKIRAID